MTASDGRNKMMDSFVYLDSDCNLVGGVCISGIYRRLFVGANESPCETAKEIIDMIVDPIIEEYQKENTERATNISQKAGETHKQE